MSSSWRATPKRRYSADVLEAMSDAQVLALAAEQGLADRLEDDFRVWCYHVYYNGPFASVEPPWLRMCLAVWHSRDDHPMRDPGKAAAWKATLARFILQRGMSRGRRPTAELYGNLVGAMS